MDFVQDHHGRGREYCREILQEGEDIELTSIYRMGK